VEKVYGCDLYRWRGVTLFFVILEGKRVSGVLMAGRVWRWYKF
jgi:hypothetical protein